MIKLNLVMIFLMVIITVMFIKKSSGEVKYVESDLDGKKYLVRDLPDKQKAANMLAKIRMNLINLSNYLNDNKDDKYKEYSEYIERLHSKIENVDISESTPDSAYTSYSVNKGEQLVFCVRSKDIINNLHDLNLVMYVALHEISHIASPEYGHTELFKKIFAFFTDIAIQRNLYTKIDFKHDPTEYCGLIIT